ncbi:MAG: AAA family ATPase [Clostridia bacterium]|nr:AAA family ATPase [Clostridia bacterium]
MFFKRMELNGFKSFADPITIEFTEGMTCIVGPNGSGKSNISDAIRWVLGEQSPKMLRGGKMEEVIFAGTQTRKPKGMAEVTLVVDNSDHILPIDYAEVGITRRMYRSGESEYMINRAPCRLRDIRELIMDTGIGVEGYSIIGQGKISDIISNKMDSRREIFEEAAGIVKYRNKKAETERKLENATQNLARVADIAGELGSRLGGLERESKKAVEYLDIREKYRDVEINIILRNIEAADSKTAAVRQEMDELEARLAEDKRLRDEIEEQIREKRAKAEASSDRLDALRSDITRVTEEIHFVESREELNNERCAALERDRVRLEGELAAAEEKLSRERANAEQIREAIASAISDAEDAKKKAEEKARALRAAEAQLAEKEKALAQERDDQISQINAKIAEIRVSQGKLSARHKLLEELEKAYEGYNGAVRFIMESGTPGLVGAAGDLLKVPRGWELAIETALGGNVQNIICEDEAAAKEAIALLKSRKAGRLTFLPADSIKPGKPAETEDIEGSDGYLGLASERVSCQGGYQNVVEYLLGRVIVCRDLDSALAMSKKSGSLRFVTLEGEHINPAGAITGGSFKNHTGNILSRRAEKERLEKALKEGEKTLAEAQADRARREEAAQKLAEEAEDIRSAAETARKVSSDAYMDANAASLQAKSASDLEERVKAQIRELEGEAASKRSSLSDIDRQKDEIAVFAGEASATLEEKKAEKAALEEAENEAASARRQAASEADALEEDRTRQDSVLYEHQVAKHDAEVRLARFDAQTDTLKEKLWEEFELSYAQAQDRSDPDFVMSRGLKESREYRERLRELGDVNVGAIEEYKAVKERFDFLSQQKADLEQAMEELGAVISDIDSTIKARFKESFNAVVANFESTFTELFKGGHARLSLEDPENPLESAIEIEAQPPGKKLQNMNLLSGGEKTMTAIALMFAVLKAKPTPFCILDEVEAALDEANIDCFARYLNHFDQTQFALITHQKATMEYADALYGVTMPEQGISRVLSLKLGDHFDID